MSSLTKLKTSKKNDDGVLNVDPLTDAQKAAICQDSTLKCGDTVEVVHGYDIYIGKKGVVVWVEDPWLPGPPPIVRYPRHLALIDCGGDRYSFHIHKVRMCEPQTLDDPCFDHMRQRILEEAALSRR